jgi:ATP-dependent Clp protease ATP-binding subunit ClpX
MFHIPSERDITKVVIDESVIKGESEPLKVYQSVQSKAAPAD